jgi:hypothetical protein
VWQRLVILLSADLVLESVALTIPLGALYRGLKLDDAFDTA